MKIYLISLFPNELGNFFLKGIFNKAFEKKIFDISFINLREFAVDKYKKVDDYPFCNHQGMVLKADLIYSAITSIPNYEKYRIIYPCPKGIIFDQGFADNYSKEDGLIFICGYYEGIDERIFQLFKIEKISLGNFVLSSGELPSLTIIETILRLLPGVVGKQKGLLDDSIINGLLEYPQYTKPRILFDLEVPAVLLGGNHAEQKKWQKKESLRTTLFSKPNLLKSYNFTDVDKELMTQILKEE